MKFSEWLANKKKQEPVVHSDLDSWLSSVDDLKKDLSKLKDTLFKGGGAPEGKEDEPDKKPFGKDKPKDKPFFGKDKPKDDKKPFDKDKDKKPFFGKDKPKDKPFFGDKKAKFGFGNKAPKEIPEGGPIKPVGKIVDDEPKEPKKKLKFNFGQQRSGNELKKKPFED